MANGYEFTNDWFVIHEPVWANMVTEMKPRRYLEVGAFEGQSTVYMIENCAPRGTFELACIDTWAGGVEHNKSEMSAVEARFDRNMANAQARGHTFTLRKMKDQSTNAMAQLLSEGGANVFDVAYIDASHQAPDVLADAVFAFKLTRVGGIMIFDDYLWRMSGPDGNDSLSAPKAGIDAFVNTYFRKLNVVAGAPLRQLYVQKTSD